MPDFSEAGNAAGGSLTITRNGDEYTITVNFIAVSYTHLRAHET